MHGAKDRSAKGAGRGVNSLERRPGALHQRHDAVSRRNRIGFRYGPYLGGSFLETTDGKTRGAPAVGIVAKLPLELPLANGRHRPCTSVYVPAARRRSGGFPGWSISGRRVAKPLAF